MPDSPTSTKVNSAISEDEVELVEETKPKSWPQTLQDLKNNNNQYPTQPLVLRPTSDLLRPPTTLLNPWAARFGSQIPPVPPVGGNFPGWIYRGIHPPMPAAFPIGRGHELMRRLCTMNPAFAQSIIEDYIRPQVRDDDVVLEIECGTNTALMYLSRLCQGSKGPCIWFQEAWITPNEFQYVSGRETAKDWKRSIRHCGKSMKLLLTKGILTTHPPICDCDGCRTSSPLPHQHHPQAIPLPPPEDPLVRGRLPLTTTNTENQVKKEMTTGVKTAATEQEQPDERAPHKLSSLISTLLRERQGGQVNANPGSLTTAAALWARHSQHLKNATSKALEDNDDAASSNNPSTTTDAASQQAEQDQGTSEQQEHDMEKKSLMENAKAKSSHSSSSVSALKQMEQMMGRNYSDFMRSLAAKYNQTSTKEPSQPNGGDMFKNASMPTNNPFLMPGHPFPLAAAAAAAAAASTTSKDSNPFPFFRPPQNMMEQVTQTQQALLNMMRNAQQQQQLQQQQQQQQKEHLKRAAAAAATASLTPKKEDVLDLSSSSPSPKRARKSSSSEVALVDTVSLCNLVSPCSHEAREVKSWSVDDVCQFVSSVELCQPFVEPFREQGIDGSTLILLKEDHLVTTMKMRLGSVLKFKAALAKKMGSCPICLHCVHCHNEMTNDTKSAATATTNGDDKEIESKENNSEAGENHESKK